MSHIYVTGARGNIGSMLLQYMPHATPVYGNILTEPLLEDAFEPHSILVHLAGKSNIQESYTKELEYHKVNVAGLERIARMCLQKNIKMIFPSSIHIYGSSPPPLTERALLHAYSPYGETKIRGEHILHQWGREGLKYVILRPGGIFGYSPGMHFDTTVNKFTFQAFQNVPLSIWKEALHKRRGHLYVGDAVRAIAFFIEHDIFTNDAYNVITGNFTTNEIMQAIREYIPHVQTTYRTSIAANTHLEISDEKIRNLGFVPTGTLKQGIGEVMRHLQAL
ncbi:MAG: NAD(P)-dependent oxidoreductase [Candidatus Paceibacterota bacterium]|nr:MAG: NAD(P)-dependent oxidoreductase [Candidatus Paceibacterota bacterium]